MLDFVHDTQTTHRHLVTALSQPGVIVDLAAAAERIDPVPPFNPALLLIAHTLLDGETSFAVVSDDQAQRVACVNAIAQRTYAQATDVAQADFIVVVNTATDPAATLRAARRGTLEDPHLSATVLLEVEQIAAAHDDELTLSGPGIDGATSAAIAPAPTWIEARNEACAEYPFGVDLFAVDRSARVLGLPRTTRIVAKDGD